MIYCSHEFVWLDLSLCLYLLQKGTTRGTLLALEHMRTDKGGKGGVIINISSAAGIDAHFSRIIFFPLKYLSYIAKCITDKFKKLTFLHLRFMFLAYYQTRLRCIEFFHWHLYLLSSIKCLHFGFCLISQIYQPFWNFYKV